MRRVLAITLAIMFVALLLSPAMGYSLQTGNHSYSIKSTRVNYSISSQAPTHQPAVIVSSRPYSTVKYGTLFRPEATGVAETAKSNVVGLSTPSGVSQASVNTSAAPKIEPKFLIQGIVYDDQNGDGQMDYNETGLTGWTVNLEKPAGTVISNVTTNNDGRYGFYSLTPGDYIVAEKQEMGWSQTAPSDGKYAINLTDNATMLNFGNKMMPIPIQSVIPPQNVTPPESTIHSANNTAPVNGTAPVNVTLLK